MEVHHQYDALGSTKEYWAEIFELFKLITLHLRSYLSEE